MLLGDKDLHTTETVPLQFSSPNDTRLCISLSVVSDAAVEDSEEQFSLTLDSSDPAVIISGGVASATITDDDCTSHTLNATNFSLLPSACRLAFLWPLHVSAVAVALEFESYDVYEGNGSLSVCVMVDGSLERNASISFHTENDSEHSKG